MRQPQSLYGRVSNFVARSIGYLIVAFWCVATLFPLVWMYYSSVKSFPELTAHRWLLPTVIHWENYVDAWTGNIRGGGGVKVPFSDYFRNSVVVTSISVLISMALGTVAAYAIARRPVAGRRFWWIVLFVGLAIPIHGLVLPTWAIEDRLGLTSTYPGLILPYVGTSLPFTVLLLAAYFEGFPRDLEDAARVDGCNEVQLFLRIVLPLAKGPMTAVAILLANGFWGEFLYSLVLMPENTMKTLPVGLFEFTAEHFTPINLVLAGVGVIVTPILIVYVLFQRQITGANLEIVRG